MADPVPPPAVPVATGGAPPLDLTTIEPVRDALLRWFAANGRDLPWRATRDPYAILVSEVMLQQIQVKRAIPFYEAFLARFPTIAALAAAPLADVIRTWGDLGRYRRAVNLHRTARQIVTGHGGVIPSDVAALRRLPGVGPYTAGAVACFAFEQDAAFLDTNMRRVLHRVFAGVDVPRPTVGERELRRLAGAVLPPGEGWAWNQGLMDLGALVCRARKPACENCPVRASCRAYPAVQTVLADLPRPARRQTPLPDGAHRVYRGRVLAALRALPADDPAASLDLPVLGATVREGFAEDDLPWLRGVVASLTKDGLAIAEEAPSYDAGSEGARGDVVRVRLP